MSSSNTSDTNNFYTWDNATTTSDGVTSYIADFQFTSWEPYLFEKYIPKWHIQKGYKKQIKHMWD